MDVNFTWVADEAALSEAVGACGRIVALDTEFQRTDTFFPIAGLYQLASPEQIWLIDPLAIEDFGSLVDLLEDPAVTKVMHACSEDLELFRHHLGTTPRGVFDTQFAHAYLSDRFSISYSDLVNRITGAELTSSQTRSNWLRRPLREAQTRYAAKDVEYLPAIYDNLRDALENEGRWAWFQEDMAERERYDSPDPSIYYRSVSRAWALPPQALARLQSLCAWRERTAMSRDLPRRRVVWDEHLYELAEADRIDAGDVRKVVPDAVARRYAEELVTAHGETPEAVESVQKPLTQSEGKVLKDLRSIGVKVAEELGVANELLARKRDLEALFRHFRESRDLDARHQGWRLPVVGERYAELLAQRI